ncbi:MAG: type II/IV secretion system ATPase subunit [Candidatus Aenigmatarchaeota archaeon]|nr:MAG: type II/IV secretion system ATPase subunit [Candidatus Aenigmarchaeota archaeon]
MKLKLPRVKVKTRVSKPRTKNIVKRMKMGIKYRSRRGMRVGVPDKLVPYDTADYGYLPSGPGVYAVPPPLTIKPKIDVELKEKEKKGLIDEEISEIGITIPTEMEESLSARFRMPTDTEEMHTVDIKYPLIPPDPKSGEKVLAYVHIKWDEKIGSLVYTVIEPALTPEDAELVENIKKDVEERLDVDFSKIGEIRAKELLRKEVIKSIKEIPTVDQSKVPVIQYNIEKDIFGLGIIEPLMQDPEIEDISCDGVKIPLYIYHRNPKLGPMRTNLLFDTSTNLDGFILKLAQKSGKSVSIADPLLDASLPDGSRVQCTMGTDIARRGSNFTIRKFTSYPLTPTHMLHYKTVDSLMLAYLWLAIEHGRSILISGGTATGKTSLLNALSLFIRPNLKILSIEDTPELRLPHIHWVPEVARSPLSVKGKTGEVTLFDLLKSSLRQRPDYIVVGEVRGKEAFVLFQQMATGHPSLATIHAASLTQLIDRLVTPPISLPPALIENIDIIVFLQNMKIKGATARRTSELLEITGIKNDRPVSSKIFEWTAENDEFVTKSKSKMLDGIARMTGLTEETIQLEILRRKKVIEWLKDNNVYDFNEVGRTIAEYYLNPERVMTLIEGSGE